MDRSGFHIGLLGLTLLAVGGRVASAQSASTYDPAQLPAFHGRVAQYDLSSRGGVNGLILDDGVEVHTARHLDDELVAAIKPGDAVTIHGLKARELPLIQAMSVTNDRTAATIADTDDNDEHGRGRGRDGGRRRHDDDGPFTPATLQGRVKLQLHDTDGSLDGVLLDDRTIVLISTADVDRIAAELVPGRTVFVRGALNSGATGKVINADAIGTTVDQIMEISSPHRGRHDR